MDKKIIADEISKAISQTQQIVPFSKRGMLFSLQDAYDVAGLVKENLGSPPEVGKQATFLQIAAGAFSLPPSHVPSGPNMLWYLAILTGIL